MSRLSRKEMKRDEVREFLSRGLLFLGEHAKRIGIGLGILALLVLVGTVVANMMGGRRDRASDALAEALEVQTAPLRSELSPGVSGEGPVFETETARQDEARNRFEAVANEYPGSKTARIAKSYVARMELDAGRPAAAREIWTELASSGENDLLTAQVILNLVELERSGESAAEAEDRLLGMLDDPASVLPQDRVLYELALTQEALGKVDESRSTYQRILDEHPTSPHASAAAEKAAAPSSPA